jgi:hypothetical protein
MLRLLLIIILIIYVFYKLGIFRIFSGSVRQGYSDQARDSRRPPNSNLNVDSAPKEKEQKSSNRDGEYIDYEEVK